MEGMTVEQLKNAGNAAGHHQYVGDGEPPTNAETLHQELKDSSEDLSEVSYAVLPLEMNFMKTSARLARTSIPSWNV